MKGGFGGGGKMRPLTWRFAIMEKSTCCHPRSCGSRQNARTSRENGPVELSW